MSEGAPESAPLARRARVRLWAERLVTAALLVFVFVRLGPQLGALVGVAPDGGRAPHFAFETLGGDQVDSEALRGKVVVLNFWATWCGPCVREIPALNNLVKKFRDRGNIVFLAITAETAPTVRRFLKKQEFLYQIAVEGRTAINTYKAFAYPTHVVIDYAGRIRYRQMGATENIGAKLENVIQSILRDLELRRPPASR